MANVRSRQPFDRYREIFWLGLFPLALVWAFAALMRGRRRHGDRLSGNPILCVGNVHVGGSGKTPVVLEICERLADRCLCLVSGYKGKNKRSIELDPSHGSGPQFYGDEPWVLARVGRCTVWVGRSRDRSLKEIEARYPDRIVLVDDGLQDPTFRKDVAICVISGARLPEDRFFMPLGDLRASFLTIPKCDAVVVNYRTQEEWERWSAFLRRYSTGQHVFGAKRVSVGLWDGRVLHSKLDEVAIAFCGVGMPETFFSDVSLLATCIIFRKTFSNHFSYQPRHARLLEQLARSKAARYMITTDKDWFKIEPYVRGSGLTLMSLKTRYELPNAFWSYLGERIQ